MANFPMALDEQRHRLFVVCRRPAQLLVLNTDTGAVAAQLPAVSDCGDVFYDSASKRLYASGGGGSVSVSSSKALISIGISARSQLEKVRGQACFHPNLTLLE
jgi:hypothetical protein